MDGHRKLTLDDVCVYILLWRLSTNRHKQDFFFVLYIVLKGALFVVHLKRKKIHEKLNQFPLKKNNNKAGACVTD